MLLRVDDVQAELWPTQTYYAIGVELEGEYEGGSAVRVTRMVGPAIVELTDVAMAQLLVAHSAAMRAVGARPVAYIKFRT